MLRNKLTTPHVSFFARELSLETAHAKSATPVPSSTKRHRQSARIVPQDNLHQLRRRPAVSYAQLDGSRTMKDLLSVNRARPSRVLRRALRQVLQARSILLSTVSKTVVQVNLSLDLQARVFLILVRRAPLASSRTRTHRRSASCATAARFRTKSAKPRARNAPSLGPFR